MPINTDISNITLVAWWGAVISTIVLIWDIYKWKTSGAKIRMTVQGEMKSYNLPKYEGKTLIVINVVNYGDRATTITSVILKHYQSFFSYCRNKTNKCLFLPNPNPDFPLPFELKQGNVWVGIGEQTEDIVQMAKSGILVCELYHSHRTKPEKCRININNSVVKSP